MVIVQSPTTNSVDGVLQAGCARLQNPPIFPPLPRVLWRGGKGLGVPEDERQVQRAETRQLHLIQVEGSLAARGELQAIAPHFAQGQAVVSLLARSSSSRGSHPATEQHIATERLRRLANPLEDGAEVTQRRGRPVKLPAGQHANRDRLMLSVVGHRLST